MKIPHGCLSRLKEANRWLKHKLDLVQAFLELKFPKLQTLPYGKHAVYVVLAFCGMLLGLFLFSFTSGSSGKVSPLAQSDQEVTLAGRTFSLAAFSRNDDADEDDMARLPDVANNNLKINLGRLNPFAGPDDQNQAGSGLIDVFDAIWDGFYGKNYRKYFFRVAGALNDGKPWIEIKERPWDGAEWYNERSTTVNGVTTRKIDKNPDKVIFVEVPLILSVNDSKYREWQEAAHCLLRHLAVSKDEAAAGCWLAGMWFGIDMNTKMAFLQWKSQSEKLKKRIARLTVWAEAIDTQGAVVVKNDKPLRECISLDTFKRKDSRFSLPLGARSDDIFELGRWSDFYREDQAVAKKKIEVEGKKRAIEEVYASDDVALLADATDAAIGTDTIFEMANYVVIKTVEGGVVAAEPESKGSSIFLETPLQFSNGDKLPHGYVKFISPSSKEGKNVRHFRQVVRKDPMDGFHRNIAQDSVDHEWSAAWIRFDYLSEETAKSIASVRCWIDEAEDKK